jgi:hypothetical protein
MMAIVGAYWFLVVLFLLLGMLFGIFAYARARVSPSPGYRIGVISTVFVPTAFGAGAGIEGQPTTALIVSAIAILFAFWWLHNMAKREP